MNNEKGLTFIGMLLTMAAVIAAALLAMRIIPVYLQHYTITHALSTLNTIPQSDFSMDPAANAVLAG